MNQNTAGAVLVLILAAVGIHQDNTLVWALAAVTAALAFLTAEARALHDNYETELTRHAVNALVLTSWATTAAAFLLAVL